MGRKSQARRSAKGKLPKARGWRDAPATQGPRYPLVRRDATEVIDGRIYPPTLRIHLEELGDTVELDAIASMCAIAEGRIHGDNARYLAALIASGEEAAGLPSQDDMDLDEYVASHARLMANGCVGYDEHGGYMKVPDDVAEPIPT